MTSDTIAGPSDRIGSIPRTDPKDADAARRACARCANNEGEPGLFLEALGLEES